MSKTNHDKLAVVFVIFIINIVFFLFSMIFSDVKLVNCLLYSFINALWMTFILIPILEKITLKRVN